MLELKEKIGFREIWLCTKCGATYGTNIGKCGCEVAEEKRGTRTMKSKRTKKMAMPKGTEAKEPKSISHRISQKERAAMLGKLEEGVVRNRWMAYLSSIIRQCTFSQSKFSSTMHLYRTSKMYKLVTG